MIETIYIEDEVRDYELTHEITERLSKARVVGINRYQDIFNRKSQNFRAQKNNPALILAKKHGKFIHNAPDGYGIGAKNNYYFSHMMNCIYDCRYCFLQGMYNSAHYVLFVNFYEFKKNILDITQTTSERIDFFSGYDCDSLALEPYSAFTKAFIPFFKEIPNANIELRTKSTQIRNLSEMKPIENCIVAYSLSPEIITQQYEHKTPSLEKRLNAIIKLSEQGWNIGLRFDPVIYTDSFREIYADFFRTVFRRLKNTKLHSVSLGGFRLPKGFFKKAQNLYPDEKLFAYPTSENNGLISIKSDIDKKMLSFCKEEILGYISPEIFYPCNYE